MSNYFLLFLGLVSAATLVAAATSKFYTKRIHIRENPFCGDEPDDLESKKDLNLKNIGYK